MKIYRTLFAATIIAFNMANFPELFGRVGFYSRYALLVLLVLATCIHAIKEHIRVPVGVLASFYVFATYAFMTSFWTENTKLSVLKWLLYVTLVLTLFVGGLIVQGSQNTNPFWPLKWVFVPIVLISMVALVQGRGWFGGNFRGYAGNSNSLGATMALTSPWLIYEIRRGWDNHRYRLQLLALAGAAALVLFFTFSRASLGTVFIIMSFGSWNLKLGRKFLVAYAMVALVVGLYVVRPTAFDSIYRSLVEKRADTVLTSRSEQLEDSWEAAKKGGVFGAGFGVSIGSSRYWNMGSFTEFAREKGNSMLAILEELGITGFMLYLVLLYSLFASLRSLALRTPDPDTRFLYRLSLGFFIGSVFHSAFEAWFMSSGPDVAVFWCTMGLMLGSLTFRSRITNERFTRLETATGPRVFVPSSTQRG